jgi:hypothetical protein
MLARNSTLRSGIKSFFEKNATFSLEKTRSLRITKNKYAKTVCFDFAAQLSQRHRWPGLPELLSAQLAWQLIFSNVPA